jgi:hypothetical protein
MNKYVRVFLKGEPVRWFDFPLTGQATFHSFVMQARFEGYVLGVHGYIVHNEIKGMMLIETAQPTTNLGFVQPAGQA